VLVARNLKIALAILTVGVVIGLLSLRSLHRRVERLAQMQAAEEQARREVLAPPISTPTDVKVQAKIFWASGADKVAPVVVELALSADPVERSKQVLQALMTSPPTPDQRTIPADAELLGFYILPDGTAIADFSDALATETPSGILSEEITVDSIARTLESNVSGLHRLKILIHGQEVETLAGHVDLTGFFDLNPPNGGPTSP
jgi:Sporulation and spore germination